MWKYLAALLVVLLSIGGLVSAQEEPVVPECADCYANIVTQYDIQTIDTVRLALEDPFTPITTVAVGNEGLSAAIIVTTPPVNPEEGDMFVTAPFARIDQRMDQTQSNLGSEDINFGDGAKGINWNKAIQAAWVANQGVKELETNEEDEPVYVKEGSWISQSTTQLADTIFDFDSREGAKVLNVDNKLAMIVDDVAEVIALSANADSTTTDTQSSNGDITNNVNIVISGTDP